MRILARLVVLFAAHLASAQSIAIVQQIQSPSVGDALAADGDVFVNGSFQDEARIFAKDSSGFWSEVQLLTSPLSGGRDFGEAVDVQGDLVAIGERGAVGGGAAHLYRRVGGTNNWQLEATLVAPVPEPGSNFGGAVAVFGDRVLVGASGAAGASGPEGAAYGFRRSANGRWIFEAELRSPAPASFGAFGLSLDLSATDAVVGSTGTAFVFAHSAAGYASAESLKPSGIFTFGNRVAISSNAAIVGDSLYPASTGPFQTEGTAHVYARSGGTGPWAKVFRIRPLGLGITLGEYVAASGNLVATTDEGSVQVRGGIRVYGRNANGTWRLVGERSSLSGPALAPSAVAIAGREIIVRHFSEIGLPRYELLVLRLADRENSVVATPVRSP